MRRGVVRAVIGRALPLREKAILAAAIARAVEQGDDPSLVVRLLADDTVVSGACREHCDVIADRLAAGEPLSAALAALPATFGDDEVALVAAGEAPGADAAATLGTWARLAQHRRRLLERLANDVVYPVLIIAVGGVVLTAAMATKVLPTLRAIHASAGQELPASSQAVMSAARVVTSAPFWLGVLALAALAIWLILRRDGVRQGFHRLLLSTPGLGAVIQARSTWIALEVMAACACGGRGLGEALRHAARAQPNTVLRARLDDVASRVDAGEPLPAAGIAGFDRATLHAVRGALGSRNPGGALARLARREASAFARTSRRVEVLVPAFLLLALSVPYTLLLFGMYSALFSVARLAQ